MTFLHFLPAARTFLRRQYSRVTMQHHATRGGVVHPVLRSTPQDRINEPNATFATPVALPHRSSPIDRSFASKPG